MIREPFSVAVFGVAIGKAYHYHKTKSEKSGRIGYPSNLSCLSKCKPAFAKHIQVRKVSPSTFFRSRRARQADPADPSGTQT
jgi:hypothetical protein